MIDRLKRSAPVALLIFMVGGMMACGEQINSSLGCPQLCTDESASLRDTVLTGAIVLDSSVFGYPGLGESRDITLRNQGDTADIRLVIRFDSLRKRFTPAGVTTDTAITRVDSATLMFFIDTLEVKPSRPITVEAFDVDTSGVDDTVRTALIPLFRAGRLLGSRTFAAGEVKDTLKIPLDNAKILGKIRDSLRLRIGLRVSGANSVQLRVLAGSVNPRVRYRVSTDTLVKPDTVFPTSLTPTSDSYTQAALGVYSVVAKGTLPPPAPGRLVIGGLNGSRGYLKFDIPRTVLDSVQVIRASLLLNQLPARSTARTGDTITVFAHPVLSSPLVTDIRTAITFIGSPFAYGIDSVRFVARDTGLKSIELVNLLRFWRAVGDSNSNRSLVLRAKEEGTAAGEVNFSSLEAIAALRPRLRITYVPRRGFGVP